jgi:DEAD/DEAH box helicase domain-containing protein
VVLDELHTYRGVFGSHTALVLRRLLRLCARYGSRPSFLCASATIANPLELVRALTGRDEWTVVARNDAPQGARHVVVWNPPVSEPETGRRRSSNSEATHLLATLVRSGVRTLAFALGRAEAEAVLRYLRAALEARSPELVARVAAYRAGYLPSERRDLEQKLVRGDLTAVVSTVALEAGIDIGGLDTVLMVGYPGTVAGFWQQAGRAGRRRGEALALLVARDTLVDQYFAREPQALWTQPTEAARIDPGNVYVLGSHLLCAAYELPLTAEDLAVFAPIAPRLLAILAEEGFLRAIDGRWVYVSGIYPAAAVSLRAATQEQYVLRETARGEVLEADDGARVWDRYYPGAIHLHQGEQYRVTALEPEAREVRVERVEVDYYTNPWVEVEVAIDALEAEAHAGPLTVCTGQVTVTRRTVGFHSLRAAGREPLGFTELDCPARSIETVALWLTLDAGLRAELTAAGRDVVGGLHAVEHALAAALPLVALCDVRDVQGATAAAHPALGEPVSFLYDTFPGGVGLVERGFEALGELWRRTREAVAACPCADGCPACVQLGFCGSGNQPLDKIAALAILSAATF